MEIWKDIKGYEGIYQISNRGNIKSLERYDKLGRKVKEKIRKYSKAANGYYMIVLSKNGKNKSLCVHRLVAEAFIPNPNDLPVINHIDENKLNNSIDNLEWCTYSQNTRHGKCIEKIIANKIKGIIAINKNNGLILEFDSMRSAEKLGFDHRTISKCTRGERAQHKGFRWLLNNESGCE